MTPDATAVADQLSATLDHLEAFDGSDDDLDTATELHQQARRLLDQLQDLDVTEWRRLGHRAVDVFAGLGARVALHEDAGTDPADPRL